ncbi:ribosome biogenesis protein Nop16 [Irpex rosettiformis]|uniref:Ribosome biogenesis protein Nop16 n=1 Tax=Irpex rosettiformis TaxID=378272 RepID=A0ACB8UI21_9APHY|nr:ribosome biogenesis protein Nop16 [Irpex rosettiformis]
MANPRQRRKMRSGSHKAVHHSRRAKKILKKQPPIRGPKLLQETWDKSKTVRQNYEALGLATSLTPVASGGVERALGDVRHSTAGSIEDAAMGEGSVEDAAGPSGLRRGFGRIVRDANGNIVDIELPEDDEAETSVADRLVEDDIPDPSQQDDLAPWVKLGGPRDGSAVSGRHVVRCLEESCAMHGGAVARFSSGGELGVLRRLVEKYGENVEGMAKDRRLNADQRTAGQLRRAIRKAGGFAQLAKEA